MPGFYLYLIKVNICIIAFYLFYFVFIRNNTFFVANRLFLVFGLFLSFIIPVLKFTIFQGSSNHGLLNIINFYFDESDFPYSQTQNAQIHVNQINFSILLSITYIIGFSIMFFKLLFSILRIFRIKKNSDFTIRGKYKIIKINTTQPFTFFNSIFIPKETVSSLILDHEIEHIRQFHWFDLLLIEIISIIVWFNPFIILYKNALKLQHEYLADSEVVKNNNLVEEYLNCMLRQVHTVDFNRLINQFYCKTIKKRIIMITKNKTSIKKSWFYLIIIPLLSTLLFAFSSSNNHFTLKNNNSSGSTPMGFPVDSKKITVTNNFGDWINPITKKKDFHRGIDFALPEGEKVIATADGVVIEARFDKENKKGNYILIKHNEEFSTFYSHLKSFIIKPADVVIKGQVIGYVGNTGVSTGPHLHYEIIKNGKHVNPKDYLK